MVCFPSEAALKHHVALVHPLAMDLTMVECLVLQNDQLRERVQQLEVAEKEHDECLFRRAAMAQETQEAQDHVASLRKKIRKLEDALESRDRGLGACFERMRSHRETLVHLIAYTVQVHNHYDPTKPPVSTPPDAIDAMAQIMEETPRPSPVEAYYRGFLDMIRIRLLTMIGHIGMVGTSAATVSTTAAAWGIASRMGVSKIPGHAHEEKKKVK